MHLDFTGKTALVTGASRGIGRRIAADLAACGAEVIVTSTRTEDGGKLVRALGAGTRHVAVDFRDRDATHRFLEDLRGLAALHVCVNNAATTRHGPLSGATEEDWDVTMDVDLKAPYFVSQAAADVMARGGYGRIVNISSIWAHITRPGRSIYSAAKFGLRGLSLTSAVELAQHGVLVNLVAPGFTRTDMAERNYSSEELADLAARIPVGRLAEVSDISRAVLFLASDLNSYITGQSLVVDGGYGIV